MVHLGIRVSAAGFGVQPKPWCDSSNPIETLLIGFLNGSAPCSITTHYGSFRDEGFGCADLVGAVFREEALLGIRVSASDATSTFRRED